MINHKAYLKQHELLKSEFMRAKDYANEYLGENIQAHFFNTRIRRVSELLAGFHQGRILDIGCGPAVVANIFRDKPIEYHGADISEAMIEVCHRSFGNSPQFAFSIQEVEALGFADASFDVVLCLGILEYVLDEQAAMRELERVLKPGGILIATMLSKKSPYELYDRYIHGKLSGGIRKLIRLIRRLAKRRDEMRYEGPKRPITRLLREKEFQKLLISGGMRIEDSLYYDFHIIPAPMDSFIPKVSLFLSRNLEFLCRSKLKFLGRGLMVKCRKTTAQPTDWGSELPCSDVG